MVRVALSPTEQIQASTRLPEVYKRQLDKCPMTDLRPTALAKWARETFRIGRENDVSDDNIRKTIEAYAEQNNWSERQTRRVIEDNGASRDYDTKRQKLASTAIYLSLGTFRKIAMGFAGFEDERDMRDAKYSPREIVRLSEPRLKDWTMRMNDMELEEMPKYIPIVVAQFEEALKMIQREQITRVRSGR